MAVPGSAQQSASTTHRRMEMLAVRTRPDEPSAGGVDTLTAATFSYQRRPRHVRQAKSRGMVLAISDPVGPRRLGRRDRSG